MATIHKLLTPEEIATRGASQVPFLRLPPRAEAFALRAERLRSLARSHAMQGYLEFIALVARCQQSMLESMPPVALPRSEAVALCHEHGMPPLAHSSHARDVMWCDALRRMLRAIAADAAGPAREVASRLEGSRDELYEAQASKLLAGVTFGLDTATAPLIGAGLQVYFTHLAITLGEEAFAPIDAQGLCPCCGSRPTASVVRIGGDTAGFRFLHCSLCSAQWHLVRIKCAHCDSTAGISYSGLDDGSGAPAKRAVLAETCDECGSYLKVVYMDRDPSVEPCADDIATLALDLLVADAGREPCGVNFMLIHGDPDAPTHAQEPALLEGNR
jgi:FdhE protein